MRRLLAGVVALALWAGVRPHVAHAAEYTYVTAGGVAEYLVATAPRTTRLVGPAALAALAGARARGPGPSAIAGPAPATPATPATPADSPPLAWLTGTAPFGSASDSPAPVTVLAPTTGERVASLRVRRAFRAGTEAARVRVLRLRVRYRDGLIVRLNGVEIARRNLRGDLRDELAPVGFAQRTRGPEWETFYVESQAAPGVRANLLRAGDNLLELDVRPHAARTAPAIDFELVGAEHVRLVRGPIVQRVGAAEATVVFETDAPVAGELRWGTAASSYTTRLTSPRGVRHVFYLRDLPHDAEIHYQVATPDGVSADHAFHTAPRAGEPIRFVVYGDVRSGHEAHARVLAAVTGEAPDFILTSGDMVMRGTDEADWQRYFDLAAAVLARFCVYPAIGNHDVGAAGGLRHLEDIFALPDAPAGRPEGAAWYSFDVADVHVVMLDSNRYEDAAQLAWLDADLAAARARGVRAIFAVCHHGPWSRGAHGGSDVAREKYVPVLEKHRVAVIFSGHDHIYQRGRVGKLTYVVSGGGGAALYKPRCGVPGKKKCKTEDGMQAVASEYHYVLVEVLRDEARLCARRPDGTAIEKCASVKLR